MSYQVQSMSFQKKCKITDLFSVEDCPADWRGTTDSNCLCCEYIGGLYIRKKELFVKCNYPEQENKVNG